MPLYSINNTSQATSFYPHLPSYNEVFASRPDTNNVPPSPTTWRDLETVVLCSGISAARSSSGGPSDTRESEGPESSPRPAARDHNLHSERMTASAVFLSSVQPQVTEELDGLIHDFDEEWLAVQKAAYAFYNHTRALATCGRRLYAVQERWYTAGRIDMAIAIDPILEAVDIRMPDFTSSAPAITSTGA